MLIKAFHGGSITKSDLYNGYTSKKRNKGRIQYGVGLYCAMAYDWACLYGRSVREMTLDLVPDKSLHNTYISYNVIKQFIKENFSTKFYKEFCKEYDPKDLEVLALSRLEIYIMNYDKRPHTKADAINSFFVSCGAQYSIETCTKGYLIRVFDFSIIKNISTDIVDYETEFLDPGVYMDMIGQGAFKNPVKLS